MRDESPARSSRSRAAAGAVAGDGYRRHPGRAAGARLRPGHEAALVRWNDFVPAVDVELKRQMPEASKALGAEVTLETHQRQRPAAAHHRRRPVGQRAPTSSTAPYNWAAPLRRTPGRRDRRRRAASARRRAASTTVDAVGQVNGKWLSVPHSIVGNADRLPQVAGSKEAGAKQFPKTWERVSRSSARSSRPRASRYGQTLGHTFGDAPGFTYPYCGPSAAPRADKNGKKVASTPRGRSSP